MTRVFRKSLDMAPHWCATTWSVCAAPAKQRTHTTSYTTHHHTPHITIKHNTTRQHTTRHAAIMSESTPTPYDGEHRLSHILIHASIPPSIEHTHTPTHTHTHTHTHTSTCTAMHLQNRQNRLCCRESCRVVIPQWQPGGQGNAASQSRLVA